MHLSSNYAHLCTISVLLIEMVVNRSIYNRKTIINMKFQKSMDVLFIYIQLKLSVIASCDVLFRPEVYCRIQ